MGVGDARASISKYNDKSSACILTARAYRCVFLDIMATVAVGGDDDDDDDDNNNNDNLSYICREEIV